MDRSPFESAGVIAAAVAVVGCQPQGPPAQVASVAVSHEIAHAEDALRPADPPATQTEPASGADPDEPPAVTLSTVTTEPEAGDVVHLAANTTRLLWPPNQDRAIKEVLKVESGPATYRGPSTNGGWAVIDYPDGSVAIVPTPSLAVVAALRIHVSVKSPAFEDATITLAFPVNSRTRKFTIGAPGLFRCLAWIKSREKTNARLRAYSADYRKAVEAAIVRKAPTIPEDRYNHMTTGFGPKIDTRLNAYLIARVAALKGAAVNLGEDEHDAVKAAFPAAMRWDDPEPPENVVVAAESLARLKIIPADRFRPALDERLRILSAKNWTQNHYDLAIAGIACWRGDLEADVLAGRSRPLRLSQSVKTFELVADRIALGRFDDDSVMQFLLAEIAMLLVDRPAGEAVMEVTPQFIVADHFSPPVPKSVTVRQPWLALGAQPLGVLLFDPKTRRLTWQD